MRKRKRHRETDKVGELEGGVWQRQGEREGGERMRERETERVRERQINWEREREESDKRETDHWKWAHSFKLSFE